MSLPPRFQTAPGQQRGVLSDFPPEPMATPSLPPGGATGAALGRPIN